MGYSLGTILLMPVTFTDGSGTKPRPVLVICDGGDDDLLVAPITSHPPRTDTDLAIEEWASAGLRLASTVRVEKLNTIARSRVIRHLGRLRSPDEEKARAILKEYFRSILEDA